MPEMTEREQVLRDLIADLREECAEKDDKIEQQAADIAILSQKNPNGDRNQSPGDPCGRSCEGQAYRIELRQALAKVEQQAKQIEALQSVSKEMARVGMQQRNDLAEAKLKNIEQAKEIEALRKALTEIAEWTDRYTSPGHPVSTVAKRALTGK